MKRLILFIIVLVPIFLSAQTPTFEWAKQIGGIASDVGVSILADQDGNVYTTGTFSNTVDFDPGIGVFNLSATAGGIFISKLDVSGNFVWAKQIAAGAVGYAVNCISLDLNRNIYIIGSFSGSADFDPGSGIYNLTSSGSDDIFISKLDSLGNFVWAIQMGGSSDDKGMSIKVDAFGNVYSLGLFKGTSDFDPGAGVFSLLSSGINDVFISKINSSGGFVWAKKMGGALDDYGSSIGLDVLGNIYVTGFFKGVSDFDPSVVVFNLSSSGSSDVFVAKLDSLGNLLWAKSIGGSSSDFGNSISIDGSSNVFLTGRFYSYSDFDPGAGVYALSPIGTGDIFISKLDASGNFVWARSMGSSSYLCGGNSIFADSSGNVYTAGFYEGTVDFDPGVGVFNLSFTYGAGGPGTTIYPDIFILKLNTLGDFDWAVGMGGTGVDYPFAIVVNKMNDVYTTGVFNNTVDFNPTGVAYNLSAASSQDIFIHKLNQLPVGIIEYNTNNNSISLFPSPTSNNLTIETTKPTNISIVNLLGQEFFNSKINRTETIDVSFLSNGIYFVKDIQNGGSVKFVKQ